MYVSMKKVGRLAALELGKLGDNPYGSLDSGYIEFYAVDILIIMTIEDGSRTYFDFKGKHMKKQKYRMDSGLYMTAHSFLNYIN